MSNLLLPFLWLALLSGDMLFLSSILSSSKNMALLVNASFLSSCPHRLSSCPTRRTNTKSYISTEDRERVVVNTAINPDTEIPNFRNENVVIVGEDITPRYGYFTYIKIAVHRSSDISDKTLSLQGSSSQGSSSQLVPSSHKNELGNVIAGQGNREIIAKIISEPPSFGLESNDNAWFHKKVRHEIDILHTINEERYRVEEELEFNKEARNEVVRARWKVLEVEERKMKEEERKMKDKLLVLKEQNELKEEELKEEMELVVQEKNLGDQLELDKQLELQKQLDLLNSNIQSLQKESDILNNISRLHGVEYNGKATYILYIPYYKGGTLADFIQAQNHFYNSWWPVNMWGQKSPVKINRKFTEYQAFLLFKQMVDILEVLHDDLNITHGDLKPENWMVFFDEEHSETPPKISEKGLAPTVPTLKLIDFGLAVKCKQGEKVKTKHSNIIYFIAPEVNFGWDSETNQPFSYDPRKADIWSLGLFLFRFVVGDFVVPLGRVPSGLTEKVHILNWVAFVKRNICQPSSVLSHELKDLLCEKILVGEGERIGKVSEIKKHPWYVRQLKEEARLEGEEVERIKREEEDLRIMEEEKKRRRVDWYSRALRHLFKKED